MMPELLKSKFFNNVLVVMSGTAIAQAIGYALMPLITRLYTPADFGILGSFNAVFCVIAAGATLQYSQAMMLPKRDTEAANLVMVSLCSVIFVTFLCAIFVFMFQEQFLKMLKASGENWFLWMLPLAVLIYGLNQIVQSWCIRRKEFKRTSISQVIRTLSSLSAQTVFGFIHLGGEGLVGGALIGDGTANINLTRSLINKDSRFFRRGLSWQRMKGLAKEYKDFPLYASTQTMLNAFSQGIPVILLSYYYGIAVAGYYSLGLRVLQVPLNLVTSPIRQVLFQKVSEVHKQGAPIYPLFMKTTGGMVAIAALPAMIVLFCGPALFALVFGEKWLIAGEYSRWLTLWLIPMFCNIPSILIASILKQQRKSFIIEVVILISRVIVLVIGGLNFSSLDTIIAFSLLGAAINLYVIIWIWKLVKNIEASSIYANK